jgi:hypothetical protein
MTMNGSPIFNFNSLSVGSGRLSATENTIIPSFTESRIINPPSRHQSTASPPQSTTLITQNGHVSMSGSAQQQQEQTSANPPVTVSQDQELFVRVFWFGWRSMNVGQLLLSLSVISTGLTVVFIYG